MSSSSSTSSTNLETSSLYRLTGSNLYSGLDTDSIIKALVSGTQSKIDKQQQLEQTAEWKRDLYRSVITDMQDFEDTYFSYTSDTNLLSATFFKTSTINSSSSVVSASGNVSNAENMVINSISQLASAASYACNQQVSNEEITSGEIYDEWTASQVGGNSMVVNYNGTDYTITLSNSVKLDSENMTTSDGIKTELTKVVDGLNDQIESNSSLSGKVSFSLVEDNGSYSLKLSATDTTKSVGISAYTTSSDSTTGQNFLSMLGLSKGSSVGSISGGTIDTDVSSSTLFNKTVSSSSYLKFKMGNDTDGYEEYTVKLGADVTVSGTTSASAYAEALQKQLQDQIDANSDLKGKITVNISDTSTGALTFTSSDDNLSVSGGSQNLLQGLGITTSDTPSGTSVDGTGIDTEALNKSYLGDTLAGNSLTFTLDGVAKTITFDATEEDEFDSADGIASYLQSKLDNMFGTDKVQINYDSTADTLQFTTSDTTSVLSITSSDSTNVLNECGALRISSGASNRIDTSKTLDELANDTNSTLTVGTYTGDDGNTCEGYTISINGKELSFSGDTTLADMISQINNDDDIGVTVSYSKTTDSFRITADDTGAQGKIYYSDVSGNLSSVLFGSMTDGTFSDIQSGEISDQITIGNDAVYSFDYDGTSYDVTVSSGTYSSISDLQAAIQSQLDSAIGSNAITVSADSTTDTLQFAASDSSKTLSITAQSSTNDPLQVDSGTLQSAQLGGISLDSDSTYSFILGDTQKNITVSSGTYTSLSDLQSSIQSQLDSSFGANQVQVTANDDGTLSFQSVDGTTQLSITSESSYNPLQISSASNLSGYTAGTDLEMNVTINGKTSDIFRSSNTTSLDSVSLSITDTTDEAVSFSGENNTDDLASSIVDFINAYNKIIDEINTLTTESTIRDSDNSVKYEPLTDAQKEDMTDDEIEKWNEKAKQGLLQNDNTLNSILRDLNEAMTSKVESAGLFLSQLGISTSSSDYTSGGQLSVTTDKLKEVLQSDPDAVTSLFTDEDGISARVKDVLDNYVGTFGGDGTLLLLAGTDSDANDTSQLTTQISQYESNISKLQDQLETEEDRYWDKFTTLEQVLAQLSAQSDYLSSMFDSSSS